MKEVEINKEMRLSEHFTLGELCKTSHQTKDGNIPSRVVIENLRNICENWLEDLRYSYNTLYQPPVTSSVPIVASSAVERSHEISPLTPLGRDDKPIIINSGYRSPEVNRLAGGSPTSNHLTGCAVDIRVSDFEQAIRYTSILLDISDGANLDFDELYIERNSAGRYWIHFAVRPKDNRRKMAFLKA